MKYKITALALLSLSIFNCTSDDDSAIDFPLPPTYEQEELKTDTLDIDTSNISQIELLYNYQLLDLYYMYAHTRDTLPKNVQIFIDKGTKDNVSKGDSYCTSKFYDVCYMYNQVKDPFTYYFDPLYAQQALAMLTESEKEIGIGATVQEISKDSLKYVQVDFVYAKSPSEKAGLKSGDIILSVDSVKINSATAFEKLISGKLGDELALQVERNDSTLSINITISEITTPTVLLHYKDSIPIIKITEFMETSVSDSGSYGEFVSALKATENSKSTIIDLRGNPGGATEQCNAMAAELLSKGDTIIIDMETYADSVKENREWEYVQAIDTIVYTVSENGIAKNRYYIFLADTATASCAEAMIAAITTNKKSPIVGQTTYGKGIGQGILDTYANGLAIITSLQGVDKNNESFHDLGIVPDYKIDDPSEQLQKAVELAKEAKAKRTEGYGQKPLKHFFKKIAKGSNDKVPTLKELKMRFKKIKHK